MSGIGLTKGDYEHPPAAGHERDSKRNGQVLFFGTCCALLGPEKRTELLNFKSLLGAIPENPWENWDEFERAIDPVRKPAKAWCASIGLTDDWSQAFAIILVFTAAIPDHGPFLEAAAPLVQKAKAERALPERVFELSFGDWNVTETTRQEFQHDAKRRFAEGLREYCEQKEEEARAAGLLKALERRNIETFYWLAGYQVLRWPIENIAEAENKRRPTVGKQIYRLAAEIGLHRRPERDYDRAQKPEVIRDALRAARASFSEGDFEQLLESIPVALKQLMSPALRRMMSPHSREEQLPPP